MGPDPGFTDIADSTVTWITGMTHITDTEGRCRRVERGHLLISRGMRREMAEATQATQVTMGTASIVPGSQAGAMPAVTDKT